MAYNSMPILEKYFNRKPCKVMEMNGEPDYGVGDFRIGQEHNASICWKEVKTSEKYY